jgi:inhibitor of cysteine peptidase
MIRRFRSLVLILVVLSLAGANCSRARETAAPVQDTPANTSPDEPADTPSSLKQGGLSMAGRARVEQIGILILESFPVQVNVVARGNLPDGCTRIDQIEQQRQGNKFLVTITTARPADQMCTQALVPFEQAISLDVAGLKAGTYTVDVNGVQDTFELAMDNSPPAP